MVKTRIKMESMVRKRPKLSDGIRQAVRESRLARVAICRAAGIDEGQFSHFMAGRKGLSIASLDRLADVLKLEVVSRQEGDRKGR